MKRIHKAIKLSVFGLATLFTFVTVPVLKAAEISPTNSTESPEERAINIFKGFFTDPAYKVTQSFKDMCCEAIPHLEKSSDIGLQELAKVLKEVCKKNNIMVIGAALVKYAALVKQHFGNMLSPAILKTRLNQALNIK